jgi:hypothetical protein
MYLDSGIKAMQYVFWANEAIMKIMFNKICSLIHIVLLMGVEFCKIFLSGSVKFLKCLILYTNIILNTVCKYIWYTKYTLNGGCY